MVNITDIVNRELISNLYKYLAIGVINTIVGYGIIFSLMYIGTSPYLSNLTGYCVGIVVSYCLNKNFNFRSKLPHRKSFPRFVFILFIAYFANVITLTIALEIFEINKYIAQIISGAVYVMIGFTGSKFVAFYERK